MKIKDIIKPHLTPSEDYLHGYADLKGFIDKKFGEYCYAISIAKKLDDVIIDEIEHGPTPAFIKHYKQVNSELAEVSAKIAGVLWQNKVNAIVVSPTILDKKGNVKYDNHLSPDFLHKIAATRAGLGWIGKTGLLVTRIFGPRLRLATILTDTRLEPESKPYEISYCGKCRLCVANCPPKAATGRLWDILTDSDRFFNAEKCREWSQNSTKEVNNEGVICGVCVSVCPYGIKKSR